MAVIAKAQFLADKNGWSIRCAEGFVDGEISRRRGQLPPQHLQIGIDDYARGFRAGYYQRQPYPGAVALAPAKEAKVAEKQG